MGLMTNEAFARVRVDRLPSSPQLLLALSTSTP